MTSANRPEPDLADGASLASRLQTFRLEHQLTVDDLAGKVGVASITVRRWENGTSRPSAAAATCLEELGFGPLAAHETKVHSTARSEWKPLDSLRDDVRASLSYKGTAQAFDPAPYVLNCPADQLGFFDHLLEMQQHMEPRISLGEWQRRLSCIAAIDGVPTAQAQLERRRPDAKSWDGNYGSHGWHRYVGRFPPHLVRALLNSFDARPGDLVCDPFLGSGTTLVEARLLGLRAVGFDICPLSCMISRTKAAFPVATGAIEADFQEFTCQYRAEWAAFAGPAGGYEHAEVLARPDNLVPEFANIERWFTPEALLGTSIAVQLLMQRSGYLRDFLATALSAEMRSIGNVDVDVVRAEYRKAPRDNVDVLRLMTRRIDKMLKGIKTMGTSHVGLLGEADDIVVEQRSLLTTELEPGTVDFIVTSPPYGVESLSYLRTHLLSYRSLDAHLRYDPYENSGETIGSEYLQTDAASAGALAAESSSTYREFFARKFEGTAEARVAMMEKFFDDMVEVARQFRTWLRPEGQVAFVIGNKRLGDHVIPTDVIVTEVFAAEGLKLTESVSHKLKTNNSNSEVPWQERIIQQEAVLLFERS